MKIYTMEKLPCTDDAGYWTGWAYETPDDYTLILSSIATDVRVNRHGEVAVFVVASKLDVKGDRVEVME